MITFYFKGHNFEYEVRNALRVFDLNMKYEIKQWDEFQNNKGLALLCTLDNENDIYIGYAVLVQGQNQLYEAKFKEEDIKLEKNNELKLKKTLVVKSVHYVLKNYYKINPEYGILTGVRPVKIIFTAINSGKNKNEIDNILKNTYEVSDNRKKLLWQVAEAEKKYIDENINKNNYNMYIGIPFCPSKCSYCSFTSFADYNSNMINSYLRTLIYEIESTMELAEKRGLNLNTIYVGGGTPSVLNSDEIDLLFRTVRKHNDLSNVREITFEAGRPDTITEEKLYALKENSVDRISINPQTMVEKTLKLIGRDHSADDIKDRFLMTKKVGFKSVNMDMILGLPDETLDDVNYTMKEIIKLRPENITVHSLAYKRKSVLTKELQEYHREYELLKSMHEVVKENCLTDNYEPYYLYRQKNIKGNLENIGYTLKNHESIYNIVIIEEIETILACGAGASSKIVFDGGRHEPVHNFKSLSEYENRIDEIMIKKMELLNQR